MRKVLNASQRFLELLLVASVAILIIPVSLQIFSRQTALIPTYIWTEEMARFCFIWMIMIGAMIGAREGTHFDVDVFPKLSARAAAALSLVTNALSLVFAAVMLRYGIKFAQFGWNQTSEIADLPMWLIFIAWPLTGFAWIVFLGERSWDAVRVLAGAER
ncbi:MAG: TRAP transporter small permease [Alphaproteobacteria bacterium]|nr:TRAP transporter small permease [Alphaproteobacteria bacterium]